MTQMTHPSASVRVIAHPDFAPLRRSFVRDVDSDVRNSGASPARNTSAIVFVLRITGQRAKLVESFCEHPRHSPAPRAPGQPVQAGRVPKGHLLRAPIGDGTSMPIYKYCRVCGTPDEVLGTHGTHRTEKDDISLSGACSMNRHTGQRSRIWRLDLLTGLAFAGFCGLGLAAAETYPDRPIKLVVPFGAGGPPDVAARIVAGYLSTHLGALFIENRPGAGGTIAAKAVAAMPPDGYSLMLAPPARSRSVPSCTTMLGTTPSRALPQSP